ncbi:hypothetical protein SAMN05660909_03589 [Chitinophaga terrae (ex Kim and Jung 2007)]|uniref:AbiEi antitoxin C-terminal domain-containing protein n=1 Tax=Chitinophaga terrae (ex Kim and Jung 2007) TaxID=408074 RepID=A0A1H4ECE9_9BACT|nr:DUF6088 family protein [Chitinophaga terrae (ex Kim and Jung 2007)]MDQ0105463.1 hypothetical protein [Chitinophaga terrae (ex Kim and Jung 2007)]GEP91504.1 hypothetical protein CTE07_31490 [Chitinophaga terrae (ex Kim and Jung 2007)]SEA81962.1 hypothetical protein SAMN05660909_03589 [Chitinophaga terrae (ex Kim and Jung 2007)]
MKVAEYIAEKIKDLPKGYVFSYSDIIKQPENKDAAIKALNRMVSAKKLAKLGKGKYYKVEETVFGKLEPDLYQVVKDLLESNGNVTGYLTGYSIYNKLGLTTQVSNTIQIGKNDIRYPFKRGRYTIAFVKQKNTITKDNIPLLQILDAIRYIKKIPDASPRSSFERLLSLVAALPRADQKKMAGLLLKYPASTRALAGAMLEILGNIELAENLRDTLNPVTVYKIPGIGDSIANAKDWNIQ